MSLTLLHALTIRHVRINLWFEEFRVKPSSRQAVGAHMTSHSCTLIIILIEYVKKAGFANSIVLLPRTSHKVDATFLTILALLPALLLLWDE